MKHHSKLIFLLPLLLLFSWSVAAPSAAAPSPALTRGMAWLETQRSAAGGWGAGDTAIRDTTAVVDALGRFKSRSAVLPPAYAWLLSHPARNSADQARIAPLVAGRPGSAALIATLRASQNPVETTTSRPNAPEGGWGVAKGYSSDSVDTALAVIALKAVGVPDSSLLPAVAYLVAAQRSDGGWGVARGADSTLGSTAHVLVALSGFSNAPGVAAAISRGRQYLLARQHGDGGWGAAASTVVESALAYRALRSGGLPAAVRSSGEQYLLSQQASDGSWNHKPYDTALVIIALGSQEVYLPVARR